MSEALERVIAEQQKEIDRLNKVADINIKSWIKANNSLEQFMGDAIYFLNNRIHPVNGRTAEEGFRAAIMRMGWCLTCECNPCECQYDD